MDKPEVKTEVDQGQKVVTLSVWGAFDFNLHKVFADAFRSAPFRNYVVSLVHTSYLDSSALGSLLQLKEFAEERSGSLVLEVAPGIVLETLEMAHFTRIMNVRRIAA